MKHVEIYTKDWCSLCQNLKSILKTKGIKYTEYDVTTDKEREQEMVTRSQMRTVPQIFIDQELVGGFDDFIRLRSSGELCAELGC